MIKVFFKTILYRLFYHFGWPKVLPINFTLSISPECNSRCQTCLIWQKKVEILKLEEWEKTLKNIGPGPFWVTISGGEPFIQPHLVELVELVNRYLKPKIINLPTNGIATDLIIKKVEKIVAINSKIQIIVNLSLDGVGADHDFLRGIEGNFEKAIKTYWGLKNIKHKNLSVGLHSVISKLNVNKAEKLFDYALSLKPDAYLTEIAERRVELGTTELEITPELSEYGPAIDSLIKKLKGQKFKGWPRVSQAFRIEYYQLVKRILAQKSQVIPCYAGITSAQIFADGTVWPCCVRADDLGNLRKENYDFRRIWFSDRAKKVRLSIKNKECACPLANAAYTNMLCHWRTLFKVLNNFRKL